MCWRRRWRGWVGEKEVTVGSEERESKREEVGEGTGSTWPGAYVHARYRLALAATGSAYLPTLNLCQPTITGYPSFLEPVLACLLARRASMPNSRGSRDARWICIKCSFVERPRVGENDETIRRFPRRSLVKIAVARASIFQEHIRTEGDAGRGRDRNRRRVG